MKIIILWTRLSAYMTKQFELLQSQGFQVLCVAVEPSENAPFRYQGKLDIKYLPSPDHLNRAFHHHLHSLLLEFGADIILCASWCWASYRSIVSEYLTLNKSIITICAFDNQYKNTPRQIMGSFISGYYIQSLFEYALVPGNAQKKMAAKLGFKPNKIYHGLYTSQFNNKASFRLSKRFVFLGRLVTEKGVSQLSYAYSQYCQMYSNPWPLHLIGSGTGKYLFKNIDNAKHIEFISGNYFEEELSIGGVLVAPSLCENWGVNIHDATRFGMPLIVPDTTGAASTFAQNGINAYILDAVTVNNLLDALAFFHDLDFETLTSYARSSLRLSNSISCDSLTQSLTSIIHSHINR